MRNRSHPGPTPEAVFLSHAGEGSLGVLEGPDLACKTFHIPGTYLSWGEGKRSLCPAIHFPVGCPLQPRCEAGGGRWSRGGPKERPGTLHFLPTFVTSSFITCPKEHGKQAGLVGSHTWMGIFPSREMW